MITFQNIKQILFALSFLCFCVGANFAQTTQFTYQGRFTDSTAVQPTNGTYEMQFKAFDSVANGIQFGGTQTLPTVQVVNGIFTVVLDFGATTFSGGDRYIEISVRPAGSGDPLTTLAPRQQFTSAPFAIKSLNSLNANDSANLGGIPAVNFVQTNDSRLTDARTPTSGSSFYIQNSTALQATSNFNVSGNGTLGGTFSANVVNSTTNFRIGNVAVFSTPNQTSVVAGQSSNYTLTGATSTFIGYKTGAVANGFSQANTFIGSEAGESTTSGGNNSFVGKDSGVFNSSGSFNSFFGSNAGLSNTTANANSFFGYESGLINSTGTRNSYFGFQSGRTNSTAADNSFFGYQSGNANIGANNAFFGSSAGLANTSGNKNTFVGSSAGMTTTNNSSNSLFGYNTSVSGSENTAIGVNSNASGNKNTLVGNETSLFGGSSNTFIGYNSRTNSNTLSHSTAIGADSTVTTNNTIVLGTPIDTVEVPNLLNAKTVTVSLSINTGSIIGSLGKFDELRLNNTPIGSTPMCLDSQKRIGICPAPLSDGTSAARIVLTEKINEQQTQIDLQATQIKQQQATIDSLKKLVCVSNPTAEVCKAEK